MKILYIAPTVVPVGLGRYGGIEKMLYDMGEELLRKGNEVAIAAPYGSVVPKGVELIETVKLPEELDKDEIAYNCLVKRALIDREWDAIHDFSHSHVLGRNNVAPVVSMIWDPVYIRYPTKAKYNAVCVSEWQARRFVGAYRQNTIVCHGGSPIELFHPTYSPERERFLFLGKVSADKGIAAAIMMCKEMNVPLDIVGGLVPSEFVSTFPAFVREQIEGTDIKFYFNVTEQEKIEFLQNARAVIYPVQQEEAHWLAGIEAWLCGAPTITFNKGAMESICPLKWTKVVNSVEEFQAAMLATNKDFDSTELVKWAVEEYGIQNVMSRWEEIYSHVAVNERW